MLCYCGEWECECVRKTQFQIVGNLIFGYTWCHYKPLIFCRIFPFFFLLKILIAFLVQFNLFQLQSLQFNSFQCNQFYSASIIKSINYNSVMFSAISSIILCRRKHTLKDVMIFLEKNGERR